ncbi:MAG TPA: hypothetical protein VGD80_24345, partial [Kofleriaceae bacterium]
MTAKRDQFEAEQHATMLEKLKTMSSVEKRQTLQEMGYDPKKVKKLKDSELDGILEGKMEAENRKTRILGMTPEELAALSPGQKIQYLVDLGIDKGDLDKAGQGKATQLFDDIMKVAHVPGQHEVKIKIKGGLLGKSWVVKVKCDAEGNTDIQAEKKGGFLSKLWGWIKLALPIILAVLGPLTLGASLIVLAIYQTANAIKNGDWLGAVIGAAGAVVGVGAFMAAKGLLNASSTFAKIASVAGKVKTVAEKAQLAMAAAKAKNAGSLLAVLASGAEAFAKFSTNSADKFAKTMMRWSEKLKTWSTRIGGAEKVIAGIQKRDPLAAIGGAFETAASLAGPKNPSAKTLERASKITGFANAGKKALQAKPPDYAAVAQAALGIANQLHEDRRIEDASRIVGQANRLKQAWDKRESDPAGLVEAALGLSEAIQLAQHDLTHKEEKGPDGKPLPDADRAAISDNYKVPARIAAGARSVMAAATAKPKPNYLGAIDAATQLIADLTDDRRIDDAAKITSSTNRLKQAYDKRASDPTGLADAALKLAEAIQVTGYDLTHAELKGEDGKPLPDPERAAITERYERATRIVSGAKAVLTAATAKPRPNYVGALDAATQLIAELTASKQIDAAAVVTAKLDAWTKAVNSKDDKAILQAGLALGEAIDGLRKVISEEHAKAKKDAEAELAPGETLPDDGGDALPPGPDASQLADPALTDPDAGTVDPASTQGRGNGDARVGADTPDATNGASSRPNGPSDADGTTGQTGQTGQAQDPLPRIDVSVTVTA